MFCTDYCPSIALKSLGLMTLALHAHSVIGADRAAFSDPVDAPTLHTALVTGQSAGDDAEYWECAVGDGRVVLHYRLLADGTGAESVKANPVAVSSFKWEANTASTATSVVEATGMRNELSSIEFADHNNMSLMVAQSVSLACTRQGSGSEQSAEVSADSESEVAYTGGESEASSLFADVKLQNRPEASYTYLTKSWVGFPAMLTYTAEAAYAFSGGYTVYCANWDPRALDPTPESVGTTIEGCDVTRQKPEEGVAKGFEPGQLIDISFGNVSAAGFDLGGSTRSKLSGSTLRMTGDGQIAIGKFNAFSVASGGNGAGGGNRKRALVGTYALDGHLIAIVTEAGEELLGFASWGSDSGSSAIDHIYINGEHFWNRKN